MSKRSSRRSAAGARTREWSKNGRIWSLAASSVAEEGAGHAAVLLIVDVTEREQAEQQRQEFTANVSHELKTPLTSIMGYAEIIEAGIVKPTDVVPFAGKIRTEAQRLLSLIEDIIRLSQLDAGGEEIPFEPIELQPLCCTVRSRLQSKADRLGLKIECAGENATVSGQRRTLEQMVFNLADNALAYNRPNGSVTIETGTDSDGGPLRPRLGYRHRHRPGRPEACFRALLPRGQEPQQNRAAAPVSVCLSSSTARPCTARRSRSTAP